MSQWQKLRGAVSATATLGALARQKRSETLQQYAGLQEQLAARRQQLAALRSQQTHLLHCQQAADWLASRRAAVDAHPATDSQPQTLARKLAAHQVRPLPSPPTRCSPIDHTCIKFNFYMGKKKVLLITHWNQKF